MKMTNREYCRYAAALAPRSPIWKDCLNAFWTGGLICVLGQLLMTLYGSLDEKLCAAAVSVTLVFLSALLTGLSVYDDIAKFAGAGTLVPITGFANSITAPAVEFRTEGIILGTCVKMFTIAGPVIVFGTCASVLYGLIYWLFGVIL